MPFIGPCFSFSCNGSNTNLEALGTVFLYFPLLPTLPKTCIQFWSPRARSLTLHQTSASAPSVTDWVDHLSHTRVDRSPRQHISRDLKSDVSISIHTVNVVSCSLTMELLHLSLSCFQIQQWMLYIGILKFQSSYFDHLYWQQSYLL